MRTNLSILIPTFNTSCVPLVRTLAAQAETISGLGWEIIVVDDGSIDARCKAENNEINTIDHCRYVLNETNVGRAAIRNRLGKEAKREWLLFIDSDMNIEKPDFLSAYLNADEAYSVVYGGLKIDKAVDDGDINGNLRYRYEKANEPQHTVIARTKHPYQSFSAANFMVRKSVFDHIHFDETIKTYGYEDVLFGKALHDNGIAIAHIDNPVSYTKYEENAIYVAKIEEALRTLSTLYKAVGNYSKIIRTQRTLQRCGLSRLFYTLYIHKKKAWRNNLCSPTPSLFVFKLYKLGYFLSVHKRP